MNQELRSQVHFVHNTDLAQFVYLLHVLAGDFKQDLKINMEVLLSGSREFIAIMGKQHIQLYDARYAYQSGYDLDQKMHEGDCQSGYVFLFQGNWQEDMQFWGNVLMFEIQVLLKDMERQMAVLGRPKAEADQPAGSDKNGKQDKEKDKDKSKGHKDK